jgi:1,4-dihydroxy-2-naphthoyl-CoA hydrolase
MTFSYERTIRFSDTDAAGVVFFARYLAICHEAYEEALAATGHPITSFFCDQGIIVPVSKSEVSYLRPLACGEKVRVELTPRRIGENSFALEFTLWKKPAPGSVAAEKRAAVARTEHVCISSSTRERIPLPAALASWVDAG